MRWGLGVLCKDPLGTGVEKQSISRLKLHRAERRATALRAEPGAQLQTHGGRRLGGHREEWCLLVGLVLCFPLTTVWCPGDKPFLERLCLVEMQPEPPLPPAAARWAGR